MSDLRGKRTVRGQELVVWKKGKDREKGVVKPRAGVDLPGRVDRRRILVLLKGRRGGNSPTCRGAVCRESSAGHDRNEKFLKSLILKCWKVTVKEKKSTKKTNETEEAPIALNGRKRSGAGEEKTGKERGSCRK